MLSRRASAVASTLRALGARMLLYVCARVCVRVDAGALSWCVCGGGGDGGVWPMGAGRFLGGTLRQSILRIRVHARTYRNIFKL